MRYLDRFDRTVFLSFPPLSAMFEAGKIVVLQLQLRVLERVLVHKQYTIFLLIVRKYNYVEHVQKMAINQLS